MYHCFHIVIISDKAYRNYNINIHTHSIAVDLNICSGLQVKVHMVSETNNQQHTEGTSSL